MLEKKRVHVIGNGPSWNNFSKIDTSDFVIGCNVTKCRQADVTMMSDIKLCTQYIHMIRWNRARDCHHVPIIASHKVVEWLKENNNEGYLEIYSTYEKEPGLEPLQLSSGHYAVLWAIENGYTDIHVWGVDSYFDRHIYSYTDNIIPSMLKKDPDRVKNVADRWTLEWDNIIQSNPNVGVTLHAPTSK